MTEYDNLYHEKQLFQYCAKHTLNNLLQSQQFSKASLDSICERLVEAEDGSNTSWSTRVLRNPHRSMWGIGNFDVNVIMFALNEAKLHAVWFDRRKDIRQLNLDAIFGLILNVTTFFGRHWLALRCLEGYFFNLDSKLKRPQRFVSEKQLLEFLEKSLGQENAELLIVTQKECSLIDLWKE